MSLERFTAFGKGYKPKVSIWSRGQIGFNRGAIIRYNLKDYKYVILFYDKDTNRAGFKFTNNEDEKGIIKIHKRKTTYIISARSFLKYHGIDYSSTKSGDMEYSKEDDMYIINLEQQRGSLQYYHQKKCHGLKGGDAMEY